MNCVKREDKEYDYNKPDKGTKCKKRNEINEGDLELEENVILELNDFPHVQQFLKKCKYRIRQQNELITKLQQNIAELKDQQLCTTRKKFSESETQTDFCDEGQSKDKILKERNSPTKEDSASLVEQIKQVAELAVQQTGFVYEETSGLYYDYNTGYYYDAKLGLYYDGNSGTYYYYDEESKSYRFHSQTYVETPVEQDKKLKGRVKRKSSKKIGSKCNKSKVTSTEDKCKEQEEGECSDSNSSSSSQELESNQSTTSDESNDEDGKDLAKTYPPCMRIIVKETQLSNLKLGTLFFIPYTGGSIGREGNHNVLIQDINISKHHAKFQYNEEKNLYEIIDLGSRNGTLLNNVRLSVAKQESDPHEVIHGSIVQVSNTKLLCHIHRGHETCGNCEPGLLQSSSTAEDTSVSKMRQHKIELKRLKTKFGVQSNNDISASKVASGYQDRAKVRRQCNGSSDQYAKTQQSSLETSIAKDNKGFELLSRMGWSEGQSLGKEGDGITEPVALVQNYSKAGFGYTDSNPIVLEENSDTKKKQELLQKMQERFNKLTN